MIHLAIHLTHIYSEPNIVQNCMVVDKKREQDRPELIIYWGKWTHRSFLKVFLGLIIEVCALIAY